MLFPFSFLIGRGHLTRKRKLAVPYTTIYIFQLSEGTQNIIREDLKNHASNNGYTLEWDKENGDYMAMSGKFCDIEEIYSETILEFCGEGEDVEEYERSQQCEIILKLKDVDMEELCKKAGGVGLLVSELLENFIGDLIDGTRTNGSDERMYANQWFSRCWFGMGFNESFLSYLLTWDDIDRAVDIWEEIKNYESKEDLDEYDEEELHYLREEFDDMFQAYQRDNKYSGTIDEEMLKVLKWKEEKDRLMNGKREERIEEKVR